MKKLILPALAALCLGAFSMSAGAASQSSDVRSIQNSQLSTPASQQLAYRYYYRGCYRCGVCAPRCFTGCNTCGYGYRGYGYRYGYYRNRVWRGGYVRGYGVRHHHRHHMMHRHHMHRR